MLQIAVLFSLSCMLFISGRVNTAQTVATVGNTTFHWWMYAIGCFPDEKLKHKSYCYQWLPLLKVNKSVSDTFDNVLCTKYKGQQSILIESDDEWRYIRQKVKDSYYKATQINITKMYVLLGGVERFGRMIPELIYSGHLKEPHLVPDTKAPCRRYAVVATWPEESDFLQRKQAIESAAKGQYGKEIVNITVKSIPCKDLKKYRWNVICKRNHYSYWETKITNGDFSKSVTIPAKFGTTSGSNSFRESHRKLNFACKF